MMVSSGGTRAGASAPIFSRKMTSKMTLISTDKTTQKTPSMPVHRAHLHDTVKAFARFNDTLQSLCQEVSDKKYIGLSSAKVSAAEIMKELRSIFTIADLREAGSFFTGDDLANEAVSKFIHPITPSSIILDPTCGAGNLLIACSKQLPIQRSLKDSLRAWGTVLTGLDVFPEFVEATKLRLILEAFNRGAIPNGDTIDDLKGLFPRIREGNALLESESYSQATHIIMNPPYGLSPAPQGCSWGGGKINAAGVFIEHMLSHASKKTSLVAILPDVLRSGSRYKHWRALVDSAINHQMNIVGQFDHKTDVDVFLLRGSIREEKQSESQQTWGHNYSDLSLRLSDYFTVSVGPVVPHRDPEEGEKYPYIFPRMLPKWEEISLSDYSRNFSGRVILPPFVAIRRTSSPSDTHRALATLICGDRPVAVENHLIVAVPNNGGLQGCRDLLNVLQHPQTNEFLNNRIRCRHLTVGAVKEIPWIEGF